MAQAGFGADTDYIGFSDTTNNPNSTQYALTSSSKTPASTEAQATDSLGDVAASTEHDTITTRVCNYIKTTDAAIVLYDTATSVDWRLGKVYNGFVVQSIVLGTSPDGRPTIAITDESCPSADALVRKISPEDLEVAGSRKATKIGFRINI